MNFKNMLIEELDNETVLCDLNESWFLTTPFIAFTAFKKAAFNSINKNKLFMTVKKIAQAKPLEKLKADALIQKEKIKHDTGITSGKDEETVYKLTPEQLKVMSEIYKKYGKKIIEEIHLFRRNILAPYQLIKKLVKKNKSMNFKEVHGLSYEDYKSALESGRKKIIKRGEFVGKVGEKHGKVDEYDNLVTRLKEIKNSFGTGDNTLVNSLMDRVYEKFNVGPGELYGFTPDELKAITDEIASNFAKVKYYINHPQSKDPPEDILKMISRNVALRTGDVNHEHVQEVLKTMNKEGIRSSELNMAVGKYLLRKEIREKIKSADSSMYKEYYKNLIDEMLQKTLSRRKQMVGSAALDRSSIDFNEKENKVWGLLPTKKAKFTGNVDDYFLKIKEDDFKGVKHFEKPEGVENAQRAIENEIKRFERKLTKIIGAEDIAKLKRYRVINNLITVKELKDAGSLFKSEDELDYEEENYDDTENNDDNDNDNGEEDQEKEENVSEEEFTTRLREYSTMELGSISELNNIKKQLDELILKMRKQNDNDIVLRYRDLIAKVRSRKDIGEVETSDNSDVKTITDIKKFAMNMLRKKYRDVDEMDQDNSIFNKMIEQYKKSEPDADKNLREIKFILTQVEKKLGQSLQSME